ALGRGAAPGCAGLVYPQGGVGKLYQALRRSICERGDPNELPAARIHEYLPRRGEVPAGDSNEPDRRSRRDRRRGRLPGVIRRGIHHRPEHSGGRGAHPLPVERRQPPEFVPWRARGPRDKLKILSKEGCMSTVGDILARKGHEVISVRPTATVLNAANLMNERGIGGVLVLEGDELVGIFTERDVLRRVVAQGRDPATTLVSSVMSSPVTGAE